VSERRFTVNTEHSHKSCPNCGNRTAFKGISMQVSEDCCNVWIECGKCGFDPTLYRSGMRYEDVWGGLNPQTLAVALECWDEAVASLPQPVNRELTTLGEHNG
jgi:hypothetical protein